MNFLLISVYQNKISKNTIKFGESSYKFNEYEQNK